MTTVETAQALFRMIERSPSTFHAIHEMTETLTANGFLPLSEGECWSLTAGGKYFVTRNDSSLLAFRLPKGDFMGFQVQASHSDSPTFRVKPNPEMEVGGAYVKLNTEKYGGMLCAPWFDRPLSVAGRIVVAKDGKLERRLVDVDENLLMIPNLAIHMNRAVNEGNSYNPQVDMLPLYGMKCEKGHFLQTIATWAGVKSEEIVSDDLYLYSRMHGTIWGANREFISCGRLDDLACAFASLQGILSEGASENVVVHAVFDNEEVGSATRQGAAATFLSDTLHRINRAMGRTEEDYLTAVARSFLISSDNAHALHPNYADKHDPTNRPVINGGIVIKSTANQKYTTDAMTSAVLQLLCEKAGKLPFQRFVNRSDMLGGSTLGNLSTLQVSMPSVDIGLPQLAMHSPYETAGIEDLSALVALSKTFFTSTVVLEENGYSIR